MSLSAAWAAIADQPFAELIAFIERVARDGDVGALLPLLVELPDREPLAVALRALADAGRLDATQSSVFEALALLEAAGLARVLAGPLPAAAPQRAGLVRVVERLFADLPAVLDADALTRAGLIIRWLEQHAPDRAGALRSAARTTADAALEARAPESLTDPVLLRLAGADLAALDGAAWASGCQTAWAERRERFARGLIAGLARRPKSLSLARAETLLSQRVYTDPGHCLIELLQNAEDAGASHWQVVLTADAALIWHDGTPFDARDVVGVLSIGQTTKSQGQIGLFGVGFKSVYAVCERPQVHSDVWQFEIADVSVPRWLARRPADTPADGTLIVLPLRDPADPRAGVDALARRALSLSAHVLLTLRNISRISVRSPAGARVIERVAGQAAGQVELRRDGAGRLYHLAEHFRSPPSAPEDDVRVAIPLDAHGRARPLPADVAQVHCHLPTSLQPGLKVLVHARFHLPVDRERIDTDDPGNQAALTRAGRLLADTVAERLAAEQPVVDLLRVAPLVADLAPGWQGIAEAFAARVADLHWLPTVADLTVRPAEAWLVEDGALAYALAGHPTAHLAVLREPRLADHARAQGARSFDDDALRALLAEAIGGLADGARPPLWLSDAFRPILRHAARWGANLDGLPIWLDTEGRLYRVLQRAPRALRPFAAPSRPILSPGLDDDPQLATLCADLPELTAEDVLADLEADAGAICERAGAGRVLAWLSSRSPDDLARLHAAPLCPDETGDLRRPCDIWRPADGPLGAWVSSLLDRPALMSGAFAARYASVLDGLGVRRFDLEVCLDALAEGRVRLSDAELDRLHAALAETCDSRSPRANRALAGALIWPDATGRRRSLMGPAAARVPTHPELRDLAPAVAWLRADLADARHVATLEIAPVTPAVLARALIEDDPSLPIGDVDSARAFLARTAELIAPNIRKTLAQAPIWRDTAGALHPLARLRAIPADPALAALYTAWAAWQPIAAESHAAASALDLAVVEPDDSTTLADLASAAPAALQALPLAVLLDALAAIGRRLAPSRLVPALSLPIYPLADGGRAPLGSWDAAERGGAHRVPEALVEALDWTGRQRLDPAAEAILVPLLDALRLRPARLEDVVSALQQATPTPAAIDAIRATLVQQRAQLPADLGLERLAVWPNQLGEYCAAADLIRPSALHNPTIARIVDPPPAALLDPAAGVDADALGDAIAFRTVTGLLLRRLELDARPGEALAAQPPWLDSVADVLKLLFELAPQLDAAALMRLPLVVDATGRLEVGPRFEATFDEIAAVARTAFADRLADPTWAVAARDVVPDLVPRMPVRTWLEAIAVAAPEPAPPSAHPTFADPEARAALYRALLGRMDVIAADPNARAALGRAAILPTAEDLLRPATSLLFDPNLPDLDLSWNPTAEVPEALRTWLHSLFHLDRKRLRVIVDFVTDGLHAAIEHSDPGRVDALLAFLARTLRFEPGRPQRNAEIAQRHSLRKRLKVPTVTGAFARPKAVLVPRDPGLLERLAAFLRDPPLIATPQPPAVEAMLRASGAAADLAAGELERLLETPGAIQDAIVAQAAFARYLAERAAASPRLAERLALAERPVVPDGRGRLRAAGTLYWPTPAVIALLGDDAAEAPHPAFAHELPEAAWRAIGFRDAADARLEDVLGRLAPGEVLDEVILRWLDDQLDAGRLTAAEVREGLGEQALFLTDDEHRHAASTLIRDLPPGEFGRRRGGWSAGRTLPRLTAALRIPVGPAPKHYRDLLDELGTAFIAQGAGLLQAEPELLEVVPRAWARLIAADAAPDRGIVAAEGPRGPCLAWTTEPALVWPEPASLVESARAARVELMLPLAGEADPGPLAACLNARGVPPVGRLWEPTKDGVRARNLTAIASPWLAPVQALWQLLPTLRAHPAHWRDAPGAAPAQAQGARVLERHGRLLGRPVTWAVPVAIVGDSLVVAGDLDAVSLADALCRDRLITEAARPATVQLIADLLACTTVEAMRLLLDARLQIEAPATRASTPQPAREQVPPMRQTMLGMPRPKIARDTLPSDPPVMEPATDPTAEKPKDDNGGLLDRFKRWLNKPKPESTPPTRPVPPPPAPVTPPRAPAPRAPRPGPRAPDSGAQGAPPGRRDHAEFFRPRGSVAPQLGDGRDWLADRAQPVVFGFAMTPSRLPTPFMYGPKLIADRFDPRTQHWTADALEPAWRGAPAGRHRVTFAGKLPPGESVLPLPLYGRLMSVDADPPAVVVRTAGDLPLVSVQSETTVRYEVELGQPPAFNEARDALAPPSLTTPTAPDNELPAECHALVDRVITLNPLDRVLAVRDFVRASYRYDPSRFEDPRLAGWLRRVSRGRANAQLAALHAARDGRHLGAGVCYELNVLVVELLRRAAVPAAVATGWVFERGQVDEPDHLWAMALLGTPIGPRWLPVDAASTRDGRPLRVRPRATARWRQLLPRQAGRAPKPAAWSSRRPRVDGVPLPLSDLVRVARHVEALTGEDLPDEAALRARCRDLLADPKTARRLAELLQGDG